MNRSVERHRISAFGATPGEVVVSPFEHPTRGPVRTPAALLVAAELRRHGWQVPTRRVTTCPPPGTEDSVLFAVSYVDRAGKPVGFGVAASAHDPAALAAAEKAVSLWRSVLRTRRLLVAAIDPSCDGARRARGILDHRAERDRPLYVLGHAPDLADVRTRYVKSLDDVPPDATVVFPPFGVAEDVRTEAHARGLDVVDTTCPIVDTAHRTVRRFADDGDSVVLVGAASRDALTALAGQAPSATVAVTSLADVDRLRVAPDRVSYVMGGGTPVEHSRRVAEAIRARYPKARPAHPDGMCYATADQLDTLRSVLESSDVVLVHGRLPTAVAATVRRESNPVHEITDLADIRPGWLTTAGTVGFVDMGPHPGQVSRLEDVLSGLGPLSTARRRVTTEIVERP